ncbi:MULTISPECIES: tol-pal system YbgF family protein [Myxococcaceae]|uniref:tetratricopeptide repeat protein n=1 Tax=Myxococcaceae TaxID=31 RepID=UPI001E430F57|nr:MULTISPECIES: outer membrane protein assembly factor BamD [Myxococcaceae]
MVAEQKPEVEKELGEIRKEVIEARNLVIKTDNLLKNLHAELKLVGKRQEDFQKRQWISSGVAYALFAILCIGAAVGISSARTSTATGERERLEKTVAELTTQAEKQRAELTASQNAERSAAEVYKLMTTLPGDERLKGIDALVKLDTSRLSSLEKQALNDRAVALRREVGDSAFERGKAAFRRNDMPTVVSELSRFLAMNPGESDGLDASFFLGTAYNSLKKHEQAVPLLTRFVEGDKKSKTRDYAMLLLAQSLQETNQLQKAADTVRDAIGTYPNSEFASQMRGRLANIKRAMNPDAAAAAPGAAPAAAPATAGAAPGQ